MTDEMTSASETCPPFTSEPGPSWAFDRARPVLTKIIGPVLILVVALNCNRTAWLTSHFFFFDQLWLFFIVVFILLIWVRPFDTSARFSPAAMRQLEAVITTWAGTLVALTAFVGAAVVYHGFALSRDEAMAQFDTAIFQHGGLIATVPMEWRAFASALEPLFMMPILDGAWASSYLPGNAAIRAIFSSIGLTSLASPTLAGLAVYLVMGIARRLWPDRPDAALVSGLLLATSTQVLVTAMTPYAMTAHLALNLLWLWFFLRGSRFDHAAAIVVGFLACGLHQVIFHPLFAFPFIIGLWSTKRRLLATYTAAYAGIGLFWMLYGQLVLAGYGLHGEASESRGIMTFASHVLELLSAFSFGGVDLMIKNVVRFVVWQNPLALPLVVVTFAALQTIKGHVVALAGGLVLTLVAMFLLLPYQGHGWGYRYLHGFIGSFCLIAAQGWVLLTRAEAPIFRGFAWTRLGLASLFALVVMLPGRAIEVEGFVGPYARAEAAIQQADSDVVIVDPSGMPFSQDLVRNDPFLRNRPLIMALDRLNSDQLRGLCAMHRISVFDRGDGEFFRLLLCDPAEDQNASANRLLRDLMKTLDCGRALPHAPQR